MKIYEDIGLSGQIKIELVDTLTGIVKDYRTIHNLITISGHAHVADKMSSQVESALSYMAVGIGTGQTQTSTTLANELDRNIFQSGPTHLTGGDSGKVEYVAFWDAGDATGAITEAGIFNDVSEGIMFCYQSFAVINKGSSDKLTITWTVEYTS